MQTAYTDSPAIAIAGMIVDSTLYRDVLTRVVEDAAGIPPGVAVVKGTSDAQVKVPTATGQVTGGTLIGVTVYLAMRSPGVYERYAQVPVMRKGRIWVQVEEAVVEGDAVFVRFAAGTGTQLGAFRKTADTATAVALPGARFLTSASASGFAQVDLTLA
jgi:hypothetical protein